MKELCQFMYSQSVRSLHQMLPVLNTSCCEAQVFHSLQRLNWCPVMEHITADKLHSIDIVLRSSSGLQIAIEVDGPSHFTSTVPLRPLGETLMRRRALSAMGWHVVSVAYDSWQALKTVHHRDEFMIDLLNNVIQGEAKPATHAEIPRIHHGHALPKPLTTSRE